VSDRELLELAAKAAGLEGDFKELRSASRDHFRQLRYKSREAFVTKGLVWDPLNDDGDALRLAHALKISIGFNIENGDPCAWRTRRYQDVSFVETDGPSALRRSIVRAAAEIGKSLR
jgi:hypothetical protein